MVSKITLIAVCMTDSYDFSNSTSFRLKWNQVSVKERHDYRTVYYVYYVVRWESTKVHRLRNESFILLLFTEVWRRSKIK